VPLVLVWTGQTWGAALLVAAGLAGLGLLIYLVLRAAGLDLPEDEPLLPEAPAQPERFELLATGPVAAPEAWFRGAPSGPAQVEVGWADGGSDQGGYGGYDAADHGLADELDDGVWVDVETGFEAEPAGARGDRWEPAAPLTDGYGADRYAAQAYTPEPYRPESYTREAYTPEPYTPEPYSPEPYTPAGSAQQPYAPEVYQPEPYVPEPYQPQPYQPWGYDDGNGTGRQGGQARSAEPTQTFLLPARSDDPPDRYR
jgi:hypothetical protein